MRYYKFLILIFILTILSFLFYPEVTFANITLIPPYPTPSLYPMPLPSTTNPSIVIPLPSSIPLPSPIIFIPLPTTIPYPSFIPFPQPSLIPFPTKSPIPMPSPITSRYLKVITPNGGELLSKGSSYRIEWESNNINKVFISYNATSGGLGMIGPIVANFETSTNQGRYHYDWVVNAGDVMLGNSLLTKYKIIVSDCNDIFYTNGCLYDRSDDFFTILNSYPAPEMVYPQEGQTLDLEGGYMFKVKPIPGVTGYLYQLFQNGVMVYENLRDDNRLSLNGEFALWPSHPFHSKFKAGSVQVMIKAKINNSWSDARIININLRSRPIGLRINVSSVDLTIEDGKSLKAFDITSTGATGFSLYGYPTAYGPGINWSVSSGGISPGYSTPVSIQVNNGINPGTYTGIAIVKDQNGAQLSIPVKVTVIRTPASRYVKIISPNGGETLKVGNKVNIQWEGNDINKCMIGYTFGPGSLNNINTNVPTTGKGSYGWRVNIGNTTNGQVKIDMLCYKTGVGQVSDQSDNFFTVNP